MFLFILCMHSNVVRKCLHDHVDYDNSLPTEYQLDLESMQGII